MRTLWAVIATAALTASLWAAEGPSYAGRLTRNMAGSVVVQSNFSTAVRVAAVNIRFATPVSGTIVVQANLNGGTYVRASNTVTLVSTWILQPDALWIQDPSKSVDSLTITCSTNTPATVVVDYVKI